MRGIWNTCRIKWRLGLLALGALCLVEAAHAQCFAHVVGYMHPYDVVPQQICNLFGCNVVPVRIPCQHPIWGC